MAVVQLSIVGKILKVAKIPICHNCLRKLTHPLQSFSASASILIHPQNLFELILRLIDSLQIILACKIRRHILSCHPVLTDIKPHEAASMLCAYVDMDLKQVNLKTTQFGQLSIERCNRSQTVFKTVKNSQLFYVSVTMAHDMSVLSWW